MITVEIVWNTDEHGTWVYDVNKPEKDLPRSIMGPFDSMADAISWMTNYPDDTDVYDMDAWVDKDYSNKVKKYINSPLEYHYGWKPAKAA